jgi:hypothetical protein
MAYSRKSILQQHPSDITNILKATTADPKDEAVSAPSDIIAVILIRHKLAVA